MPQCTLRPEKWFEFGQTPELRYGVRASRVCRWFKHDATHAREHSPTAPNLLKLWSAAAGASRSGWPSPRVEAFLRHGWSSCGLRRAPTEKTPTPYGRKSPGFCSSGSDPRFLRARRTARCSAQQLPMDRSWSGRTVAHRRRFGWCPYDRSANGQRRDLQLCRAVARADREGAGLHDAVHVDIPEGEVARL